MVLPSALGEGGGHGEEVEGGEGHADEAAPDEPFAIVGDALGAIVGHVRGLLVRLASANGIVGAGALDRGGGTKEAGEEHEGTHG